MYRSRSLLQQNEMAVQINCRITPQILPFFTGTGYRICSERYSMTFWLLFNVYLEKFDQLLTKLCAPVVVVRNVRFDNVTVSCQMVQTTPQEFPAWGLSPEHARSCTNALRSFPSEFAILWPETAEVLAEATNNDFKKCMEPIKQNMSGKHSKGGTI